MKINVLSQFDSPSKLFALRSANNRGHEGPSLTIFFELSKTVAQSLTYSRFPCYEILWLYCDDITYVLGWYFVY